MHPTHRKRGEPQLEHLMSIQWTDLLSVMNDTTKTTVDFNCRTPDLSVATITRLICRTTANEMNETHIYDMSTTYCIETLREAV